MNDQALVGLSAKRKKLVWVLTIAAVALGCIAIAGICGAFSSRDYAEEALSAQSTSPEKTDSIAAPTPPVAYEPPALHFDNDPDDALAHYSTAKLFALFKERKGPESFVGKQIRLRGKVVSVGDRDVTLMGNKDFLTFFFVVQGFGDSELNSLKNDDEVEVICSYSDEQVPFGDRALKFYFHGTEIHKLP